MAARELERILTADVVEVLERHQHDRTFGILEVHLQAGKITRVHANVTELIRAKPDSTPIPGAGRDRK